MNIGIIHGFVGGGGGTEKTLFAILDALEKTDHSVTLYTFSKPKIKSDKIKIKSFLPISIPAFGLYQRAMESKLISKAKDQDVLIQASGGLGIPQRKDQKIIVYCHNDFSSELENPSTKYTGIWLLYYKSYQKMIQKFVENIHDSRVSMISNSQFVHDSILSKLGKESSIVYPPVNLKEFTSKKKENQIVTIGRFSEEKNLEFGIDVMKGTDCDYAIIGNTKTKSNSLYYDKLESKLKKEKIHNIRFLKNIPRTELIHTVNTAKVYFHCSRETFGISTIEAIAAGCIPIVPDVSSHKETVPYSELRYEENNVPDAREKIIKSLDGSFDELLPSLMTFVKKYDSQEFMNNLLRCIENL